MQFSSIRAPLSWKFSAHSIWYTQFREIFLEIRAERVRIAKNLFTSRLKINFSYIVFMDFLSYVACDLKMLLEMRILKNKKMKGNFMMKILIATAVMSFSSLAMALDPCQYQTNQNSCLSLGVYGCHWVSYGAGKCGGGPTTGMNPCIYQVNQDGCSRLAVYGCYWTSGQNYCTSN